jgi:hypothetical protein
MCVILWYAINDSNFPLMMVFRKTDLHWIFVTRTKKAVDSLWEVSLLLAWRCKEVQNEEAIDVTDFEFEHFCTGSGNEATNKFHLISLTFYNIATGDPETK